MEREMIHYLCWDLAISGADLQAFTDKARNTYRKGVPKAPYVVIPDTSREKDLFGKGHIEAETVKKVVPLPAPIEAVPALSKSVESPSYPDPPPSYTTYPDEMVSPYSDSSSSSSSAASSREPSPCVQTPPDDGIGSPSALPGKPVHIDFAGHNASVQIHDTERERGWGWAARTAW
jgi:hypothetical protein